MMATENSTHHVLRTPHASQEGNMMHLDIMTDNSGASDAVNVGGSAGGAHNCDIAAIGQSCDDARLLLAPNGAIPPSTAIPRSRHGNGKPKDVLSLGAVAPNVPSDTRKMQQSRHG